MTVCAAAALGVGAMIGAGIFALMGEAGSIAGSATWISFLIAGGVALLSGYSMAKLGARYPAAGGIVEYLTQGYDIGLFSGALSILLYISALLIWLAILATLVTIGFAVYYLSQTSPLIVWLVAAALLAALSAEGLLHRIKGRRIQARTP